MECLSEAGKFERGQLGKVFGEVTSGTKHTDVDEVTTLSSVLPKKIDELFFFRSGSLEPIPIIFVSYIYLI